ncbi:MAG: GNAT family N-acetyltransferase [Cytophagales bacterium]|nr:GNAT family N-acetyltransferase [Cytophagales bacterium]
MKALSLRALFFCPGALMTTNHFNEILYTPRLILRKFGISDAPELSRLLKDKEVAATTLMLPYPIDLEKSKEMIRNYIEEQELKKVMRWTLTLKKNEQQIIGGIRLVPNQKFNSAEIGFWLGKNFWRKGYAFEAAMRVIEFGFNELEFNRLEAHAMAENKPSIMLLEKLGYQKEGYHPDLVIKWGAYKDVVTFGLLRKNYLKLSN